MQTTSIDEEAGWIRLPTVLAHSSGEWLSSEWPVCEISETAAPAPPGPGAHVRPSLRPLHPGRDRGRRDLDAPDLEAGAKIVADPPSRNGNGVAGDSPTASIPKPKRRHRLTPEVSQNSSDPRGPFCDRTIRRAVRFSDCRTRWPTVRRGGDELGSHRRLPDKNLLTTPDAQLVEDGLRAKVQALADESAQKTPIEAVHVAPAAEPRIEGAKGTDVFAEVPEEIPPSAPASWARPFACATRNIPDTCPGNLASYADAPLRTRIIFALRSPARSAEGQRRIHFADRVTQVYLQRKRHSYIVF
jgi:hypothetical protein